MPCLISAISLTQECCLWEEVATFLAWNKALFSVASAAYRSASGDGSFTLPDPLPRMKQYYIPPAVDDSVPVLRLLTSVSETRRNTLFWRLATGVEFLQLLHEHAVEAGLSCLIPKLHRHRHRHRIESNRTVIFVFRARD